MKKLIVAFAMIFTVGAWPAVTKVGNGSDGRDIEKGKLVEDGRLVQTRNSALNLLKDLNVQSVAGLGNLIPELERSPIYKLEKDVVVEGDDRPNSFEADMRGRLYARTFPEPYAATRFFPAAESLSDEQLMAVHIHEALHRALPESIREDEDKVAAMTLAITAPEASNDRIQKAAIRQIPERDRTHVDPASTAMTPAERYPIPDYARVNRPSTFSYSYMAFSKEKNNQLSDLTSMQLLKSHMYPFGDDRQPIGLGIELGILSGEREESFLGPVGVSLRTRLWSSRGFDIGAFAKFSAHTMSSEQLKESPYGRDILTVGMEMEKSTSKMYIENTIAIHSGGEVKEKIGADNLIYEYGTAGELSIRAGAKLGGFKLGGVGQLLLSDYFKMRSASQTGFAGFDSGRFYLLSVGPELTYAYENLELTAFGRAIISRDNDVNYDYVGNILGQGTGQSYLGLQFSVNF